LGFPGSFYGARPVSRAGFPGIAPKLISYHLKAESILCSWLFCFYGAVFSGFVFFTSKAKIFNFKAKIFVFSSGEVFYG
jgi:hypothetical protein